MTYRQLILVYLKIGMFGFGGDHVMPLLIQHEVVDYYQWLTLQRFADAVTISQMAPEPTGINSITYVGYSVTQSVWGAITVTIAVRLSSFILVLLISYFLVRCKDNEYIKAAMFGLLPTPVSLIAAAALLLMNEENFIDYRGSLIFAVAFGVTQKWNIHPVLLITLSGITGYILY